jgi:hypothetical protein
VLLRLVVGATLRLTAAFTKNLHLSRGGVGLSSPHFQNTLQLRKTNDTGEYVLGAYTVSIGVAMLDVLVLLPQHDATINSFYVPTSCIATNELLGTSAY